ncbi:hypothetical protein N7535_009343 [Penicillium sp. DV-2018c]|nr:hypothetical protein N7535_009343 [Penicillium sp. DV-2018c]
MNSVLLSANHLDIQVLRKIASQEKFRHQVTEIIWDETLLYGVQPQTAKTYIEGDELLPGEGENTELHESDDESGVPKWFKSFSKRIIQVMESSECRDESQAANLERIEQRFNQLSLGKRWQLYLRLFRQQKDVLDDQSDLEAFAFGVKQFTSLKRVTITPARHGWFTLPIYPTSLTHAFPKGFRCSPNDALKPVTACDRYPGLVDRNRWFRTAIRVLADEPNSVSELVMTFDFDSYSYTSQGINCAIFNEDSAEYNDFVTMLQKPGFRRLDLTLYIGGECEEDIKASYQPLLKGRLRQVLGEAKDIEEFTLNTAFLHTLEPPPQIPLQSIVPLEHWSKLRHFGLCGFALPQEDCVSFLQTVPKSVRTIKLGILMFTCNDGCFPGLLDVIKGMISRGELWGDRDRTSHPKITVGMAALARFLRESLWLEKEVEDVVYGGAANLLEDYPPSAEDLDAIGVLKDAWEPDFEHPYVCIV